MALSDVESREFRSRVRSYRAFQVNYRNNPAGFVHDCFKWRPDRRPADYQAEILEEFPVRKKVAVRAPHGVGKTAIAAWLILWFALTRDRLEEVEDWKVPTTASAWRQLTKFLWPEVHKWARLINWGKVGRPPFVEGRELLKLNLQLATGEAFSAASNQPATMEGAHAESMLYLFDESKTIPDEIFDVADGATIAAGPETGIEAFELAISTPGEPLGRFYEIHSRKKGLTDWWCRHITCEEGIKAGRISRQRVGELVLQWGRKSAVFQNRVLGEFASSAKDVVIPLAWVELAIERWHAWHDNPERTPAKVETVGVDVSYFGPDVTVIAPKSGPVIIELRKRSDIDTDETAALCQGLLTKWGGIAIVDIIGPGAGVYDQLRKIKESWVLPFVANKAVPELLDATGELGFADLRAAAWWRLRELLNPDNDPVLCLPPDDDLIGDLTAPRWRPVAGGPNASAKIRVESKDDIKVRLGRSTDSGDAVIQACSLPLLERHAEFAMLPIDGRVSPWKR